MTDIEKLKEAIGAHEAFPPGRMNEYGKTALECMRLVLAAKSAESEVEAVARALCKEDRLDPDEDPNYVDGTVMTAVAWPPEARLWWRYRRQACAALTYWNAGARVMREKAQQVCLEYEAGYGPSESASERLACRECARMIGFIPIPQAALPHSQVMCDETWNTGAEAMREAAALYMDVEEQSGYADAIRDIPIPARPK